MWEILYRLSSKNRVARIMLANWNSLVVKETSQDCDLDYLRFEQLVMIPEDNPNIDESNVSVNSFWTNIDMRILGIYASNFRGIPYNTECGYGINLSFCQPDIKKEKSNRIDIDMVDVQPASTILLGENGSGKTSLYGILEYIFTGSTSVARKHRIKKDDLGQFYKNIKYRDKDSYLYCLDCSSKSTRTISPSNSTINSDEPWEHLDFSVFFCSESDLAIIECSGVSMQEYLDSCIGLDELNDAVKLINHLKNRLQDKWVELKALESEETDDAILFLSNNISLVKSLGEELEKTIYRYRSEVLSEAQNIITSLLAGYLGEEVELGYAPDILKEYGQIFNGSLKRIGVENSNISPREYFNNFRFKLYLISLKVAIAFHIMKERKIAFPLIFDDVFDSSDFQNRLKTKEFIQHIFSTYERLDIHPKPLQLIFFTQDEVIAESIYEGITESAVDFNDSRKNTMFNDTQSIKKGREAVLAHLFSVTELDDSDQKVELYCSSQNIDEQPKDDNSVSLGTFYNLCDIYRYQLNKC